jgi:16S rRNA (adenine1518-N6/adenine1519-N6)-dimethyltransferase
MNHIPRKRFGQNFLRDEMVIHHIIMAIAPKPQDRIVEIGPGQGALTWPLLDYVKELDVVELDRDLIERLGRHPLGPRLRIHAGDALEFDFSSLGNNLRVVGNLPYNISTPLLFHLAEFSQQMKDAHFMLQKEVVDRLAAEPATADYGRLSVMVQYRFHVEALFEVPPEAFYPAPKVVSAVVRLIPKPAAERKARDEKRLEKLVQQAFSQRRKMLRSTLKQEVPDTAWVDLQIDSERRAETLSLDEFVALANYPFRD